MGIQCSQEEVTKGRLEATPTSTWPLSSSSRSSCNCWSSRPCWLGWRCSGRRSSREQGEDCGVSLGDGLTQDGWDGVPWGYGWNDGWRDGRQNDEWWDGWRDDGQKGRKESQEGCKV